MQVLPLVSDLSDDRFVSPVESEAEVYTSNYGSLGFRNSSQSVMIVPCHAGYVVKQAAQDHAMAHAAVVGAGADRTYDTAMCVQQSQGGLIRRGGYRMLILPYALREQALQVRNVKSYSKLWEDITRFNRSMGVQAAGHLEFFLKQFRKELDEFVAEFECVPHQVGAVVLVDNQIVGIERAPSHAYWRSVWPSLIRECYGSLALQVAHDRGPDAVPPFSRTPLRDDIRSLDELESAVADVTRQEEERARSTVRQLLDEKVELQREETTHGLAIATVSSRRFTGQVIRDGQRIVYASMPTTRQWLEDGRWEAAPAFTI